MTTSTGWPRIPTVVGMLPSTRPLITDEQEPDVANEKTEVVMSPDFRVAFSKVFTPELDDNGVAKYSLVAIFPKGADLTSLKQLVKRSAEKKWGGDRTKWPEGLIFPFKDGKDRVGKYEGFEEGSIFVNLSSKYPPRVVDEKVVPIINQKDFYSGCWARATINAFTYEPGKGKRTSKTGVSLGVNDIQKVRDDKPFLGRPDVTDVFRPVEGAAAPAASADDYYLS